MRWQNFLTYQLTLQLMPYLDKTDKKIADLREEFRRQLEEIKNTGMVHDIPMDQDDKLEQTNSWLQKLDNAFEAFQSRTDDSIGELGQATENLDFRASQIESKVEKIVSKNTNNKDKKKDQDQ